MADALQTRLSLSEHLRCSSSGDICRVVVRVVMHVDAGTERACHRLVIAASTMSYLFRAHCKERVAEDFATANLHGYLFVFDVGDTRLKAGKRKCNAHTQLEHDSRCMRPSCSSHVHVHDAGKEGYRGLGGFPLKSGGVSS